MAVVSDGTHVLGLGDIGGANTRTTYVLTRWGTVDGQRIGKAAAVRGRTAKEIVKLTVDNHKNTKFPHFIRETSENYLNLS